MDTPRIPVTKTIGRVTFTDPYDWLQHDTPETLAWMSARDAEAQAAAQGTPGYAAMLDAETAARPDAGAARSVPRRLGGRWFWTTNRADGMPDALWTGNAPDAAGHLLANSAALASAGEDAARVVLIWYEPSPDGRYVACGCTASGAMTGAWRIVDVAMARVLEGSEPCTAYAGGLPGWLPDGSGYYLGDRVADGRHRARFVTLAERVAPRAERVFSFEEVPAAVSGLTIEVSPDGRRAIALSGPHERTALMIGDLASDSWRRFVPVDYSGECQGAWLDATTYVARASDDDHPRGRIVAIDVERPTDPSDWRVIEAQGRHVLRAIGVVHRLIVVADVLDCSTRFRILDLDGGGERLLPLQGPGSSNIAFIWRRFDRSEGLCLDYGSFTRPTTIFHYDFADGRLKAIGTPEEELEGIRVTQRFAKSIDGVRVPYFVVHRADLDLSRPQPALITGYGGFNIAQMPTPLGHLVPFVQAGGIYIHTNLRGGAEYGKQWHESGRLACKWNVFADLFAIAEQAIAEGLTTPERFGMFGGSNGGLLAAVVIAHRPDLFRVVVPIVPVVDQMEPLPPDAALDPVRAIFLEDYGDPAHPVMSKVLHSYSPYHHVREGTAYPAVYQVYGEKDVSCRADRGRKFTAALRAATTSGRPIHMRVWKDTGHGTFAAAFSVEWLAFAMHELGMDPAR